MYIHVLCDSCVATVHVYDAILYCSGKLMGEHNLSDFMVGQLTNVTRKNKPQVCTCTLHNDARPQN